MTVAAKNSAMTLAELFYRLGLEDLGALRLHEADRNLRLAQMFAPAQPEILDALSQLYRLAQGARVRGAAAQRVDEDDLPPIY